MSFAERFTETDSNTICVVLVHTFQGGFLFVAANQPGGGLAAATVSRKHLS